MMRLATWLDVWIDVQMRFAVLGWHRCDRSWLNGRATVGYIAVAISLSSMACPWIVGLSGLFENLG